MTRSAPTHRCSWLRTTLRVIAVFVGISACALPRLVHGQSGQPLHATTSGSVSGECRPVQNYAWGGFGTQLTGGHVAGEGVGRKESISYIGLQPYMLFGQTLAFGDARLTRGNEGELAWSFGGGLRHYISQWDAIVGGNSYLDRDQLSGANCGRPVPRF